MEGEIYGFFRFENDNCQHLDSIPKGFPLLSAPLFLCTTVHFRDHKSTLIAAEQNSNNKLNPYLKDLRL